MAIAHVKPGDVLSSGTVNALIDTANGAGTVGIVPGLTAPGAGSAAVSTGGAVTFTNASNVSLNGCFTGQFSNYKIVLNISGRSAVSSIAFRLRQAGADLSTSTYAWVRTYASGSASPSTVTATSATFILLDLVAAAGQDLDGTFDVHGPASGQRTALMSQMFAWWPGGPTPYLYATGGQNSTTAASDGFTLYPDSGGTITGTVRVYGYNNLT